jgi:iron complex outermembrane receptor protein
MRRFAAAQYTHIPASLSGMSFPRAAAFSLLATLLPVMYVFAQSAPDISPVGQIVDSSDSAIMGASVHIQQVNGSLQLSTVSNRSGRFTLPGLPPGEYTIQVKHPGFEGIEQTISFGAAAATPLTFHMQVASTASSVTVNGRSSLITEEPTGQTQFDVSRGSFRNTPAFSIGNVLALVPGVTFVQGNGPRDISISVRGSNERQTYGVRNTKIYEDGFPVTQPDGLGRTDLTDPHAYSSIDVVEGPSSTLFGNYATGGAINFHTRTGSEIQGLEVGTDFGSFGYYNDYITYGVGSDKYQASVFLSNVRADQATANNQFNTITANILATVAVTPKDRLTFKFIDNDLDTNLSLRLSLRQYRMNPYQHGCEVYRVAASASGCASASLYLNGFNGATTPETAAQAGFGRHDRRTITGARWEHDLTPNTVWRTQFVFDDRDINQPTTSFSYRGPYPSFNVISDFLRRKGSSTTYAGGFFNYENINSFTYNVVPGGDAALGAQTQTVFGKHLNAGFRAQQELTLAERWTLVAGLGAEFTGLQALANDHSYPTNSAPVITPISANRTFFNLAPEVALQYRPSDALRIHTRFGTGYGTPQATQLFVTSQGTNGNNTQLKTQRNYGIDLGADWQLGSTLQASATGFYEWFHNEQVTQSAGVSLQSYTFNAPASAHRGVEAGIDWHPLSQRLPGAYVRAAYQYDNQVYTDYTETLTSGAASASFNRGGTSIPGVQPNFLNARLGYDQPTGRLRGFGGFLEANWRDNYRLDNANLLSAPGYTLVNLSTHYDPPAGHGALSRLRFYFDVQNLANKTYVASANNITNSLNTTTGQENDASVLANATGSIYAGTPRASYGGVRVRF